MANSSERRSLEVTLEFALRNYKRCGTVLGAGIGRKFVRDQPTSEMECLQFYVTRKERNERKLGWRSLPKFVYLRKTNGEIDYTRKIPTDVINIGRVELACGAGDTIDLIGSRGSVSMLFSDKSAASKNCYLITCAHVVGDLSQEIPVYDEINSECCNECNPLARVIYSAVHENSVLEFDIALARVEEKQPPHPDLTIREFDEYTLDGFSSSEDVFPGDYVNCSFPASHTSSGVVESFLGVVSAEFGGSEYLIKNAYLLNANAIPGDSGGLIHKNGKAVGVLFGHSPDGWGWFHILEDAVSFLKRSQDIKFECF